MNLSGLFILRPVATILFMVAILLAGIISYLQLPVSALPQVDYPTMQVLTFYPGASPDVVASSITAPLEKQLGQVPGLQQMTSTSSQGCSVITLQFNLSLNIDVAEQQVQQSINAAGTFLPANLPNPPIYSKSNPADAPVLTLALYSKTLPLTLLEDFADTRLAAKISQLPGVGLVSINGGQKPAVRIQANPTALASYGLNLEDVRTVIASASVNQAKGSFDGPTRSYQIGANDQLLDRNSYANLVMAYRNNAPVHLSDVAEVIDSAENVRQAAWMNEQPAIIINIQRQPGANTIAVVNAIKKLLPQLKLSLPAGAELSVLSDRTTTIRASVLDVQFELLLTIALVVMVIFLFLRNLAATLIPSISVPLSLVGAFAGMFLFGFSVNNLTLMALTISTGFVVDDAIVMIENITRYIEAGEPPLQAALKGAGQIGFTIISLTISLIAVLIPLLFMGDIVGRLFREFAITLSLTILLSAVVSLTLTPMLCARLLKHRSSDRASWFYRVSERGFEAIIGFYGRTLTWVLRIRPAVLLVALGTFLLTIFLYSVSPKGLFPIQDTGIIQGISEGPQTISFTDLANRQQTLTHLILQDPAVASLTSFIGVDGTNLTPNSGRIQINLKPLEERNAGADEVIRRLQNQIAQIPGIQLYLQPVQDLTVEDRISRTQFQYSLECPDSATLQDWSAKMMQKLQDAPALIDVASDQQNEGLRTSLAIDRDSASRLNITTTQLDNTLYDAFGQRQVSTLFTQLNQYHVILEVSPDRQKSPANLNDIYLNTTTGTTIPLGSFTRWQTSSGPLSINHQGQFPVVTLSFNLAPGASLGAAIAQVQQAEKELNLPASVQGNFQGATAAFLASQTNEPLLILAALVTVYIILGVLYESFIHPITILSTLPSAGVGALLALQLCHNDLNVIALIGIILLIGIVQKNAIMMIDFALAAERTEGRSPEEAIYQACLLRFRPILMTTMAALLGGLPLALGSGIGAELRRPLGIAIVGGLIVSQVLTLYTTPVIYLWFDWVASKFSKRRRARMVAIEESESPGAAPATP